jgi:hypothetical protein
MAVVQDQTKTHATGQEPEKAKPVAVDPADRDAIRKEQLHSSAAHQEKHISPAQTLNLVQEAKKVMHDSLPVIPLLDGSEVQIVTLSNGKFFLYPFKQNGSFPIEYNFSKGGVYENAKISVSEHSQSKTYTEQSQELLHEIKNSLEAIKSLRKIKVHSAPIAPIKE